MQGLPITRRLPLFLNSILFRLCITVSVTSIKALPRIFALANGLQEIGRLRLTFLAFSGHSLN